MKKLASLRAHLLGIPGELKIDPKDLQTFADKGRLVSAYTGTNEHFEIRYTASVIVTNFNTTDNPGAADQLFLWLLLWVHANQPDLPAESVDFEADILSDHAVDVAFSVPLNETVRVERTVDGIVLHHSDEPSVLPELLTAPEWTLFGNDVPLATWLTGG